MFKGLNGLNPGNQAFKQFKCLILNALIWIVSFKLVLQNKKTKKVCDSVNVKRCKIEVTMCVT